MTFGEHFMYALYNLFRMLINSFHWSLHVFTLILQKGSGFGCPHSSVPHGSLAGQFARTSLLWSHHSSLSPLPSDTHEGHNSWNIMEHGEIRFLIFKDPAVVDFGNCWHHLKLKMTHRCSHLIIICVWRLRHFSLSAYLDISGASCLGNKNPLRFQCHVSEQFVRHHIGPNSCGQRPATEGSAESTPKGFRTRFME